MVYARGGLVRFVWVGAVQHRRGRRLLLAGCHMLPDHMRQFFTCRAEFLAACKSGALRLVLRSLPRRNPVEENPVVILNCSGSGAGRNQVLR